MLTGTTLALPPTLKMAKFVALFKLATMRARFQFPILAATIETGHLAIPMLPSLMYRPVDAFAEVSTWADEVIVLHHPETDAEKGQTLEERTEHMRNTLGLRELVVAKQAKQFHLVFSGRPEEKHMVTLLVYAAHAVSDASTEMLTLRKQLAFVGEYAQAPYPLPELHPLHPAQLAWGEEVERLPPALHDLLGVEITAFSMEKAQNTSGKIMRGHSLRLDEGREPGTGLCATHHTSVVLSEADTASVYRAAKSKGWSMTQVVDAARHMAYIEMRRAYLEEKHDTPIRETLHTNFLMPRDGRPLFVDKYKTDEFAGNATLGFVTILPLREPYFVPAAKERQTYFWRKKRNLSQVRVLCKVTAALAERYADADGEVRDAMEGITPLLMVGGLFSPEYPPNDLAPEGFSSVGILERHLPREYPLPGHAVPIRVTDWFVGLTMSRHMFSLQFSFHVWSFEGRMHLSVIHTDRFSVAYTEHFLHTIKDTLLLFAEAYDPEAPPPEGFWENCACM